MESTSSRGYGTRHQKERKRWARILQAEGMLPCASPTCNHPNDPITPGSPWDLGHDTDRSVYRGPEHQDCNRREGGRNGAQVTNANRTMKIREW